MALGSFQLNGAQLNGTASGGTEREVLLDQNWNFATAEREVLLHQNWEFPASVSIFNETVTEGFTLDELDFGFIGGAGLTTEAVSDGVSINLTFSGIPVYIVNDQISMNDTVLETLINVITENITLNTVLSSNAVFQNILQDSAGVQDALAAVFPILVTEDITLQDTPDGLIKLIERLLEAVTVTSSTITQLNALSAIAVALSLNEDALRFLGASVSENLTVSDDDAIETLLVFFTLAENINITQSAQDSITFTAIVPENITFDNATSVSQQLSVACQEGIVLTTVPDDNETIRRGWVMNPETFAVWNYTNFAFDSMANFNGSVLLADQSGLYRLEGTRDLGQIINLKVTSSALDFGTSNLKQIRQSYVGITTDGQTILVVKNDGRNESRYRLRKSTQFKDVQHMKVGKGLKGHFWQFEIIDETGDEFELEFVEVFPVVYGRKR